MTEQEPIQENFHWRHVEDPDGAETQDRPATRQDVREGRVADPNLGDVPVENQPHPGSADPFEGLR